ncbi:zinc finger protein-like 1 [Paramacrobiotus metropolitanus]|uniref:zinc finger protein-like 1 n=1 Tax=Paramacrobiotus metropolitanus TaxID=2943436 RepID=UPI002445A9BF|nr:zinc finger protein-like 1 [Paramacrobiotus metropolitanus]
MGLCKCPRRRMTNLFCFEHHVNVCEECVVHDHNKCVIKSYLNWLEDSGYDATCPFCHRALGDSECARLTCYHLFHWSCLNRYASQLPANTAPAGYKCYTCSQCIFPKGNLASPVADALRQQLETVNWGRAGLGLPLLDGNGGTAAVNFGAMDPEFVHNLQQQSRETTISFEPSKDHSKDLGYERETVRRAGDSYESKATPSASRYHEAHDSDSVEVKYKRKPFGEWFQRLIRAYIPRPSANDAKAGLRRLFISVLVILVMLLTFGVFLTSVNRAPGYEEVPDAAADLPEELGAGEKAVRLEGMGGESAR